MLNFKFIEKFAFKIKSGTEVIKINTYSVDDQGDEKE